MGTKDDIAKRVAARWAAAAQEGVDMANGVLTKWDLEDLPDPSAWKGYRFKLSVWAWEAATYEDADEPSDWGDPHWHGPVMTLDEVIAAALQASPKWAQWIGPNDFQSPVKRTKKLVTQVLVSVERGDGKNLSYNERKHIERTLKLKG